MKKFFHKLCDIHFFNLYNLVLSIFCTIFANNENVNCLNVKSELYMISFSAKAYLDI